MLDLFDKAGEEAAWSVGVPDRSCDDNALWRFGGTVSERSSSALGRFSAVFVAGTAGLTIDVGADVDVDGVSVRRAAIFGIGFTFFCTGSSTTFVRILTGDSFGGSWRSFFSGKTRFGGRRSTCLTVAALAFENFNFTTNEGSFSSTVAGGAVYGDFPLTETDRMRWSVLTVLSANCGRSLSFGTDNVWLFSSVDDADALDTARDRCCPNLSNSACIIEGRVGDKILGNPYGLLRGSCTGDNSGGRPCGVELEGLDLSTTLESSSSIRLIAVAEGRGGS